MCGWGPVAGQSRQNARMVMLHSLWYFVGAMKAAVIGIAVANACGASRFIDEHRWVHVLVEGIANGCLKVVSDIAANKSRANPK